MLLLVENIFNNVTLDLTLGGIVWHGLYYLKTLLGLRDIVTSPHYHILPPLQLLARGGGRQQKYTITTNPMLSTANQLHHKTTNPMLCST